MAQHQNPCEICERVKQCESGTHPGLICETSTGWAVLGDLQFFRGYSLLLCKTPHTELDELAPDVRWRFLQEMSLLAEAVRRVVQPHKLNYEALGNQVHHLHWHVFPRQAHEVGAKQPVWGLMPTGEAAEPFKFDAERDEALKQAIRSELQSLLAQHQTE